MDFNSIFHEGMLENLQEPEFKDFEQCSVISNEGLKDYVSDIIPAEHMNECSSIDYNPNDELFENKPSTLAYYDVLTNEIKISDADNFKNDEAFLDTIVHEIGHNEYNNDFSESAENVEKWQQIHNSSLENYNTTGNGCVSGYAATNAEEDFCESYSAYIRDPELLKFHSMEKYDFMKDVVFDGREYHEMLYAGNDTFVSTPTTLQSVLHTGQNITMEDFIKITKGGDIDNLKNTIRCFDKDGCSS